MKFQNMTYVAGEDYAQPELVIIKRLGHSGRMDHHMVLAMPFLYDDTRTATSLSDGSKVMLDQEEVLLICEYIRQNRNALKFSTPPKTFEDWQRREISLEDYMPLGYLVGANWLSNLASITTADTLFQLATAYEEPFDRPKMEADVYYTFANKRGEWRFAGICAYNSPINLVPELRFYAKIESSGPAQIEYFEKQWNLDTRVMHYHLYRRPYTASYLSRSQYLAETGGMNLPSSLSEQDIIAEACSVQWKLQYYQPNASVYEASDEIRVTLSDTFSGLASEKDLASLIRELPYDMAVCRYYGDDDERKLYFCIPKEAHAQSVGLGDVQKREFPSPSHEQLEALRQEAAAYYRHGKEYFQGKMLCTFYTYHSDIDSENQGVFLDAHGHSVFCVISDMWRNLPDIAQPGSEIVAVDDLRFQPISYLLRSHQAHVEQVLRHGNLIVLGGRCSFITSWGHEKNGTVSRVPVEGDDRCIVKADDGSYYYVQKQDIMPEQVKLGSAGDYPGKPFVRFSALYSTDETPTLRFTQKIDAPPFDPEEPGALCETASGDLAIWFPDGASVVFRHDDLVDMAHQFKLCADAGYAADVSWACRDAG